jgi:hypothetical protein
VASAKARTDLTFHLQQLKAPAPYGAFFLPEIEPNVRCVVPIASLWFSFSRMKSGGTEETWETVVESTSAERDQFISMLQLLTVAGYFKVILDPVQGPLWDFD